MVDPPACETMVTGLGTCWSCWFRQWVLNPSLGFLTTQATEQQKIVKMSPSKRKSSISGRAAFFLPHRYSWVFDSLSILIFLSHTCMLLFWNMIFSPSVHQQGLSEQRRNSWKLMYTRDNASNKKSRIKMGKQYTKTVQLRQCTGLHTAKGYVSWSEQLAQAWTLSASKPCDKRHHQMKSLC